MKKYPNSGPPMRIQVLALGKKTAEAVQAVRDYLSSNKNLREETKAWLKSFAR